MTDSDWQVEQFEQHRPHLRAVAYRMLGSMTEADDALQEAWIRLSRSDTAAVDNLGGWLTTVVGHLAAGARRDSRRRTRPRSRRPSPRSRRSGRRGS